MVQIRRKEQKAMNTSECEKGDNPTIVSSTLLSWTYQILRNLHNCKAACILVPCFLTNFLITKSRLSLTNTEILSDEHIDAHF